MAKNGLPPSADLKKSYVYIGRSKGAANGVSSPLGPISFIFMQFLAKIQLNNMAFRKFRGWRPRPRLR